MADKKTAAEAVHEDVVYAPEAATPVVAVEANDPTKLNTLSVVSLATAVTGFGAVAGVITGHISLAQLRRSGEKGRGLALAGLITGYVGIAGFALLSALSLGGALAHNRLDNDRGFNVNSQQGGQFGGMMGGNGFGQRDRDNDGGWGMMGGQNNGQGQLQVAPGQGQLQVAPGQGGTITLDGNGNPTITLPNGQTITIPDGGPMGGKGFGPMGNGQGGQVQVVPAPTPQAN